MTRRQSPCCSKYRASAVTLTPIEAETWQSRCQPMPSGSPPQLQYCRKLRYADPCFRSKSATEAASAAASMACSRRLQLSESSLVAAQRSGLEVETSSPLGRSESG